MSDKNPMQGTVPATTTQTGSAQNANPATTQRQSMNKMMKFQMVYMLISLAMLFIIFNTTIRNALGSAMSVVFMPIIGFNYALPWMTITLMGVFIGLVTSVPRYFFTDWLKMGRVQNRMSAFNKVYSASMRSGQKDKMQKLSKMRMEMTMEQSQLSMNTMKPLMVLTIFTLLFYVWLYYFLSLVPYQIISFPWDFNINIINDKLWLFPYWFLGYFLASLPVGYFATMIIKYFDFKYKIRELERKSDYAGYN